MEGRIWSRAIKHVYDVIISGETIVTTVTNQGDAITEWINAFNAERNSGVYYIGFEVELNYNSGPIGTVQLCVDKRCLVIQLVHGRPWPWPPSLDQFLSDSNNIFAGVNMENKLNMLLQQIPCIRANFKHTAVDLLKNVPSLLNNKQKAFGMYGLRRAGSTVDYAWCRTGILSDEQVHYACVDAFLNLQAAICISTLENTTTHVSPPAGYF